MCGMPRDRLGIADGVAAGNLLQQLEQRALHQWKNRFRLGITKSTVELDHPRTIWCEHQSRVQQSLERTSSFTQRGERWQENAVRHVLDKPRCRRSDWGVCSHSTGVRAEVAVEQSLVIL